MQDFKRDLALSAPFLGFLLAGYIAIFMGWI